MMNIKNKLIAEEISWVSKNEKSTEVHLASFRRKKSDPRKVSRKVEKTSMAECRKEARRSKENNCKM